MSSQLMAHFIEKVFLDKIPMVAKAKPKPTPVDSLAIMATIHSATGTRQLIN